MEALLEITPDVDAPAEKVLCGARVFLEECAERRSQLDETCLQKLQGEIVEMEEWVERFGSCGAINTWEWLMNRCRQARVMASGPQPGHLHVASIQSGGHSGRPNTFIVGMDDGRFPRWGLPDPVLLDGERKALSPHLATTAERVQGQVEGWTRLVTALQGRLTLSFSSLDIQEDRERFPSSVLLAVFRWLHPAGAGDLSALTAVLGSPAASAPGNKSVCLNEREWWLRRTGCGGSFGEARRSMEERYPHLGQGREAVERRLSQDFTEYDGWVRRAGEEAGPLGEQGRTTSASALEMLGRCPLAYFFRHILHLEPPEKWIPEPGRWLDAREFGQLVHRLLERTVREWIEKGPPADAERLMDVLLEELVRPYQEL